MNKLTLIATAPMGLESIVSKELKELGFTNLEVENGRVTYDTDVSGMIKSSWCWPHRGRKHRDESGARDGAYLFGNSWFHDGDLSRHHQ